MNQDTGVPLPSVEQLCRVGRDKFEKGELDSAMSAFQEALHIDSRSAQAHNGRGAVLLAQRDVSAALDEFILATQIDPTCAKAFVNLGTANFAVGNLTSAIECFNQALWLDHKLLCAYENRGLFYFKTGKYSQAKRDFSACIQLSQSAFWAYARRALSNLFDGDTRSAMDDINEALRIDPGNVWCLDCRGCIHFSAREFRAAVIDYTAVIDDFPYAGVLVNRGRAYLELGNLRLAHDDFNAAIACSADNADAHYYRAVALWSEGKRQAVVTDLEFAARLDPHKFPTVDAAYRRMVRAAKPTSERED